MRFFALSDFQHMVLALFLGLSAVVALYLAWSGYSLKRGRDLDERELAEARISSEDNPIAPILLLIYAAVVVCVIVYLVLIGILGGPF
jgi:Na+/H+ antiporter NhaC